MYLLARRLGYSVSINERASKETIFRYTMTKGIQRKSKIAIKKYVNYLMLVNNMYMI